MVINPNNSRYHCEGCEGGPYPHHEVDLPCTAHAPVKPPRFPCQVCQVHDRDPWQPLPHPWWPLWRPATTGDYRWLFGNGHYGLHMFFWGFISCESTQTRKFMQISHRYQEWWLKLKFQRGRLFCLLSFFGGLELILKEPLLPNISKPDVGRNIRKFFQGQ